MDIKTLHLIEGAKKATGLTVIIDVFRAFTVEAYVVKNGAKEIITVGDAQKALDYKKNNPECILIGEKDGKILPGFDYGNSPSELENVDFSNKTVVQRTGAGTQGIVNATKATEIITGSLVNAKAVAEYIKESNETDISLVCMGLNGKEKTEEDILCAKYIKSLIENDDLLIDEEIEELKNTSGSKFFDKNQQDIFPERDFHLCVKLNLFDFVLKVEKDSNGLNHIKKFIENK